MREETINKYRIRGKKVFLDITSLNGETQRIVIDRDDLEKVKEHKWYYARSYVRNHNGSVYLSHLVTGFDKEKGKAVTFKNKDRHDYRKSNLKIDTLSNIALNSKKRRNNTSNYTGVIYDKHMNGWTAEIYVLGKTHKKRFSIQKYGYEQAKKLAVEQRAQFEKEFINR